MSEAFWTEGVERRGSEVRRAEGTVYSARQAPSRKCARSQAWRKRRATRQERHAARRELRTVESVADGCEVHGPRFSRVACVLCVGQA